RREVRLRRLAGTVCLREPHLARRPMLRTPPPDPPLQRPQVRLVVASGTLHGQQLEHRQRLQARRRRQHLCHRWPVLREWIWPSPPPPRLLHLRRQLRRRHVPPRRRPVHVRFHCRPSYLSVFAHLFHQSPYLRVADRSQEASCPTFGQDTSDRSPPPLRMGRCHRRRWGDVIVAQQFPGIVGFRH